MVPAEGEALNATTTVSLSVQLRLLRLQRKLYTPFAVTETEDEGALGGEKVAAPGPFKVVQVPTPILVAALSVAVVLQSDWFTPASAFGMAATCTFKHTGWLLPQPLLTEAHTSPPGALANCTLIEVVF